MSATQVLMGLRFTERSLFDLLQGASMIDWEDFPLIRKRIEEKVAEKVADTRHDDILRFLTKRFGEGPNDLADQIRQVTKD
jgi:hypothetical protein